MKVFISHSSNDKPFVRKLKSDLKLNNIQTFVDEDSLELGDSLKDKLNVALDESTHFIIVLSEYALKSPWVKYEIEEAFRLLDKNTLKKIIPIKYRECEIPDRLSDLLYIELTNEIVEEDGDKVRFITKGYAPVLERIVNAIRSNDTALNLEDKIELKKEVNVIEEKNRKEFENVIRTNENIVKYRDSSVLEKYQQFVATSLKTSGHLTYEPILLPSIYKAILKDIQIGETITFGMGLSDSGIKGQFAGFSTKGLVMSNYMMKYLNVIQGKSYSFVFYQDKRAFVRVKI